MVLKTPLSGFRIVLICLLLLLSGFLLGHGMALKDPTTLQTGYLLLILSSLWGSTLWIHPTIRPTSEYELNDEEDWVNDSPKTTV